MTSPQTGDTAGQAAGDNSGIVLPRYLRRSSTTNSSAFHSVFHSRLGVAHMQGNWARKWEEYIDHKTDYIRGTSTRCVCQSSNKHRRDPLEDHISGNCQINLGGGHMKTLSNHVQRWEVYLGCQGRKEGAQRSPKDNQSFLPD